MEEAVCVFLLAGARLKRKIERMNCELHEIREMVDALSQKIDENAGKQNETTRDGTGGKITRDATGGRITR